MGYFKNLLFICSIVPVLVNGLNNHVFPDAFMFGAATASYQVEGGWNADGKGIQIWDKFTHDDPTRIIDASNGDIACDSYHKYKDDVQLLKDLGVAHYRFSLSWSRILPEGFSNKINDAGVTYYKNLIQELKDNNIEPLITLYHWDLPQPLQDLGGWTNDKIVDWFEDYARLCFQLFGDSVKYWMTVNEPVSFCLNGYGLGVRAPGVNASGIGEYMCTHNVLKTHARVWHVYDEEFRAKQNGKVGIVCVSHWFDPASDSEEDIQAAQRKVDFMFGWYANPLFNGDYPVSMKEFVARRSAKQGFSKSRLPEFTAEEIEYIKGTVDLLGVNVYTVFLARALTKDNTDAMGFNEDAEVEFFQPDDWQESASDWLKITPWAMRNLTNWIKNTFNNPQIIITENGMSDNGTSNDDDERIFYIQTYLSSLRDAMELDDVDAIGYTHWSIMDNFEWMRGYTEKFGLYRVDFNSENRTRTAKKSVDYYKKIIQTKCLVDECE